MLWGEINEMLPSDTSIAPYLFFLSYFYLKPAWLTPASKQDHSKSQSLQLSESQLTSGCRMPWKYPDPS